jgi:hypothetical protein
MSPLISQRLNLSKGLLDFTLTKGRARADKKIHGHAVAGDFRAKFQMGDVIFKIA